MIDDIRKGRIEKLEAIKKAGEEPYPTKSWRTHLIADALDNFASFAETKQPIVIVGRIMARREHGGSAFFDLKDNSGKIQIFLKKDVVGEKDFQFFLGNFDIGDFIEANGFLFSTKQNEPTLQVEKFKILSKSLLPLPEKWHGLQDAEERFRRRYLDLIFNPEVKEKFETRAQIIQELRNFLLKHDFIEVQTPTLQLIYGGASARPFKTHMNALDLDLFLRIAPELFLKRLLVGGFERVFEFTTNFRNEGMDRDHNPEFSGLEWYCAFKDLSWAMEFTEDLFTDVLTKVFGSTTIKHEDKEIHFAKSYQRATFADLFEEHTGIDYDVADEDTMKAKAKELNLKIEKFVTKSGLADEIFKKVIRPKLVEPTFVTDWPSEILPLAKKTKNPEYVEAFQFFAGGLELIKAFTELNDPLDQRERFKAQEKIRAKGDEEAQMMDEDYVEALEYGMPPAAGWGLGLDRFVALLTNSHSIREVILFPLMKPKEM